MRNLTKEEIECFSPYWTYQEGRIQIRSDKVLVIQINKDRKREGLVRYWNRYGLPKQFFYCKGDKLNGIRKMFNEIYKHEI